MRRGCLWLALCALALGVTSCSAVNPTASLDYVPSRLPIGPVLVGTWLPAGMNSFRFSAEDRALLEEVGINSLQWLQRHEDEFGTAEAQLMRFASERGWHMPAYYEPADLTPYDKLHNWATRAEEINVDSLRLVVDGVRQQWALAPAFAGYLVGHEDYNGAYYPALATVVQVLGESDPRRPVYSVGRLRDYQDARAFFDALFDAGAPGNVFQQEHYVFRGQVPEEGRGFQRRIADLVDGYDEVVRGLEGRAGRWHAIVQVQSEVRGGKVYYRKPTAAEIRLQVGLALSRGASGIVYFLYSSGVEELRDAQGNLVETRLYEGLVDLDGLPTPSYAAVQRLNGDLHDLSRALEALHFHGALSSRFLLQNEWVKGLDGDAEVGLFGDGQQVSHLLLVNRWGHAAQRVRLQLGAHWTVDGTEGRVELELAAGDFRLLRIEQRSTGNG